jgi:eukaryotic-like serine/threonine-protein kinase
MNHNSQRAKDARFFFVVWTAFFGANTMTGQWATVIRRPGCSPGHAPNAREFVEGAGTMSTKPDITFLERIRRSGLVSQDTLLPLWQWLETRGVDLDNDKAVADTLVELEVLTGWQAEKLLEGKYKGFFLGSFRLLRPLGRGTKSAVFMAQHAMVGRPCAIKILPYLSIRQDSTVLKQFYVQAQAMAVMDHWNIVRAYDVNKETKDGRELHCLVMEFVDGRDLQTLVREEGVLDYVRAADYLRQTANGLSHVHKRRLVHRKIEPANLMVDKRGVVKIVDFGNAVFLGDTPQAPPPPGDNKTPPGTADCLSPEQAWNRHTADQREDIYGLGCTAYFLLTGRPPFPAGTAGELTAAHRLEVPQPIQNMRPDAPPGLIAIIDRMMARQPDERVQTAAEIAKLLAAWLFEHGGDEWKRQHGQEFPPEPLFASLS